MRSPLQRAVNHSKVNVQSKRVALALANLIPHGIRLARARQPIVTPQVVGKADRGRTHLPHR
jgi:hypothetical protein